MAEEKKKNEKSRTSRPRNKFMCCICGDFSESGPGFCSVNLHYHEDLKLNERGNSYLGWWTQGGAHLACLESYIEAEKAHPQHCMVCGKQINETASAIKLAIYVYRRRGCSYVLSTHEECFKSVKHEKFWIMRPTTRY